MPVNFRSKVQPKRYMPVKSPLSRMFEKITCASLIGTNPHVLIGHSLTNVQYSYSLLRGALATTCDNSLADVSDGTALTLI